MDGGDGTPDASAHRVRADTVQRMSSRGLVPLFACVAFAAVGAGAVAAGLEPAAVTLAIGAGIGGIGGNALARHSTARQVAAFAAATHRAAEGTQAFETARGFGALAPAAIAVASMTEALNAAREAATTDRLTQVANRPTVLAHLFAEVERVSRYGRPLSIAFVDIDHFKTVNDTYGHETGDVVLREVAAIFREHTRGTDMVARYGGEEFVLVFPETSVDEATVVAEKLRVLVMRHRFPQTPDLAVSISIGIAGGQGQHLRVDQLLRDADAAMYSAKSLGRNQTFVFAEIDDDSARIPRAPITADARARAAEVGDLGRQAAEAALAAIIDPLPHYRGKPSSLIAAIAVRMGRELEQPEQEVQRIRVASLLHDIGKVAIPEQILEKPGDLSADEWQTVVQHPRLGQVIIDEVATVRDAGAIILHHHERFSGHGYPFGLRGSEIPLGARIVAIADAYDAMVHDRPYRASIGHRAAIAELRRHAQLQFDPELVQLFCDLYAGEPPQADPTLLIRPPVPIGRRNGRTERRRASTA